MTIRELVRTRVEGLFKAAKIATTASLPIDPAKAPREPMWYVGTGFVLYDRPVREAQTLEDLRTSFTMYEAHGGTIQDRLDITDPVRTGRISLKAILRMGCGADTQSDREVERKAEAECMKARAAIDNFMLLDTSSLTGVMSVNGVTYTWWIYGIDIDQDLAQAAMSLDGKSQNIAEAYISFNINFIEEISYEN